MRLRSHLRSVLTALLAGFVMAMAFPAVSRCETKEEKKAREREKKELERMKKEEKRSKKEEKMRVEEAKKYDTLMDFALDYYASDPDFHEAVDKAYADLQRNHAIQAFQTNMARSVNLEDIIEEAKETEGQGGTLGLRRRLYDNPRIQDYVNRVGQRLVPMDSEKLYAFKVTQSPIPSAFSLSTGTIYVSAGLVSMVDNEAQLAYVLSHEVAHVYRDHHRLKYVMMPMAEEEFNRKKEKKRALVGAVVGGIAGGLGGAFKGKEAGVGAAGGAAIGAGYGAMFGAILASALSRRMDLDWEYVQENEADDFALKNTLERNYDVQEIPKLYLTLARAAAVDQRISLGFLGNKQRVKNRIAHVQKQLQTTFQGDYQNKLKAGVLIGTSPEYQLMMAELKRDNGILAYFFDMFSLAQQNLRQAVSLRSDDGRARFFYGLVSKQVARTPGDQDLAKQELLVAVKLDENRHDNPEAQLQRAVMLMDRPDAASQAEAVQALKNYILAYQDRHVQDAKYGRSLPPNMDVIYDYFRLLGEPKWKAPFPEFHRVVAGDVVITSAPADSAAGVQVAPVRGGEQAGRFPVTAVKGQDSPR